MKKTLCLFGATFAIAVTSCSKETTTEKPKNYYGVQSDDNGTAKEAYYAFFGGILVLVFGILYLLKKMGGRK